MVENDTRILAVNLNGKLFKGLIIFECEIQTKKSWRPECIADYRIYSTTYNTEEILDGYYFFQQVIINVASLSNNLSQISAKVCKNAPVDEDELPGIYYVMRKNATNATFQNVRIGPPVYTLYGKHNIQDYISALRIHSDENLRQQPQEECYVYEEWKTIRIQLTSLNSNLPVALLKQAMVKYFAINPLQITFLEDNDGLKNNIYVKIRGTPMEISKIKILTKKKQLFTKKRS
uniref:Uncharacterized protein n=1 Tax=Acrobeloides nanus TaxID=290746 RepID=A0A914DU91_9BILA